MHHSPWLQNKHTSLFQAVVHWINQSTKHFYTLPPPYNLYVTVIPPSFNMAESSENILIHPICPSIQFSIREFGIIYSPNTQQTSKGPIPRNCASRILKSNFTNHRLVLVIIFILLQRLEIYLPIVKKGNCESGALSYWDRQLPEFVLYALNIME